ncbi:hypothetical protein [Achromobacter spanius]
MLETGVAPREGPPAEVAVDPRVVEVYLGLGHGAPAPAVPTAPAATTAP